MDGRERHVVLVGGVNSDVNNMPMLDQARRRAHRRPASAYKLDVRLRQDSMKNPSGIGRDSGS